MSRWRDVQERLLGWEGCLLVAQDFDDHYSLSEEQQAYVYQYAMQVPTGGCVVELGVCNGKTSAVLSYCARARGFEAHGVDVFILENSPDVFRKKLFERDLPFILHHAKTTNAPIPQIPHNSLPVVPWGWPIDLLLIDGSHTEPWISADCERWLPFVKPGSIVMFHDYPPWPEQPDNPHEAVRFAVDRTTRNWSMEYYIQGLMVKRKPL